MNGAWMDESKARSGGLDKNFSCARRTDGVFEVESRQFRVVRSRRRAARAPLPLLVSRRSHSSSDSHLGVVRRAMGASASNDTQLLQLDLYPLPLREDIAPSGPSSIASFWFPEAMHVLRSRARRGCRGSRRRGAPRRARCRRPARQQALDARMLRAARISTFPSGHSASARACTRCRRSMSTAIRRRTFRSAKTTAA